MLTRVGGHKMEALEHSLDSPILGPLSYFLMYSYPSFDA